MCKLCGHGFEVFAALVQLCEHNAALQQSDEADGEGFCLYFRTDQPLFLPGSQQLCYPSLPRGEGIDDACPERLVGIV